MDVYGKKENEWGDIFSVFKALKWYSSIHFISMAKSQVALQILHHSLESY